MIGDGVDRYFEGTALADPLEAFPEESVVKLHQAVEPEVFSLNRYEHKSVTVDPATMDNLRWAQQTIRQVKMVLPYDAGNQKKNVVYTGGESWARTKMLRTHDLTPSVISDAALAAAHQSGYCSEMADTSFTLLSEHTVNAPVLRTNDKHWDHAYVLIGDPRDSRWGEKNTVVVDPWVHYPSATTLAEADGYHPKTESTHERAPNEPPDPDVYQIHRIHHVSTNEVNVFLEDNNWGQIGSSLLSDLDDSGKIPYFYDKKRTARDPSTVYSSRDEPQGTSMDYIAQATVERQRRMG